VAWKQYFVYLMTNFDRTVLYTGVTSSLDRRVWQHKNGSFEGFTKKYKCDRLVCFEEYSEISQAIAREKQIKGWTRAKKNALISAMNAEWKDLAADWFEAPGKILRFAQDDTQ
jgi:putative endonuclease